MASIEDDMEGQDSSRRFIDIGDTSY